MAPSTLAIATPYWPFAHLQEHTGTLLVPQPTWWGPRLAPWPTTKSAYILKSIHFSTLCGRKVCEPNLRPAWGHVSASKARNRQVPRLGVGCGNLTRREIVETKSFFLCLLSVFVFVLVFVFVFASLRTFFCKARNGDDTISSGSVVLVVAISRVYSYSLTLALGSNTPSNDKEEVGEG